MSTKACLNLVFGEDEMLVSDKARQIAEATVPEADRAMGLEIYDGRADTVDDAIQIIRRCHEGVATPSFFSACKLVWLKQANFLYDTVTGRSEFVKTPLAALMEYVKNSLPAGHHFLISAPKVDKRFAVYKTMKECGTLHDLSGPDKPSEVAKHTTVHLSTLLQRTGLRMRGDVRTAFIERVGSDTRQMLCELEKLACYLDDRQEVTIDDVRTITSASREAIAWDISDAFGRRDLGGVLQVMGMLFSQKQSPILVIVMLEKRVRELLLYREALDGDWLQPGPGGTHWGRLPAAVAQLFDSGTGVDPRKTHPYRTKLMAEQAARFSIGELRRIQHELEQAHIKLVSSSLPQGLVLELALTRALYRPLGRR